MNPEPQIGRYGVGGVAGRGFVAAACLSGSHCQSEALRTIFTGGGTPWVGVGLAGLLGGLAGLDRGLDGAAQLPELEASSMLDFTSIKQAYP